MSSVSDLLKAFLTELQQNRVLELAVSRGEVEDDSDMPMSYTEKTVPRKFQACDASKRRKYLQLFSLAALVTELMANEKTILLRDVYYSLKHLFRNQMECSSAIYDLGRILRMKRHDMRIIPSSKAMIFGPIRFKFSSKEEGEWIDCDYSCRLCGHPIDYYWVSTAPDDITIEIKDVNMKFLIVIEKEAIFHRLVEDQFTKTVPCILVTSCGYPDVAARAAVHRIANFFPSIQVLGFADYNPHGYRLLECFKYPSPLTTYEAGKFITDIKWLGLRSVHIQHLLAQPQEASRVLEKSFQPLSKKDKIIIQNLLAYDYVIKDEALKAELQRMLEGEVKCEIEALYCYGLGFITGFVQSVIEGAI